MGQMTQPTVSSTEGQQLVSPPVASPDNDRSRFLLPFSGALSRLKLDTIVPAAANPLRRSVIILAPARCCYMTSYLTLCLLIRCDHVTIVLLPEYCRNCEKGIHYGRLVGCKLYKICFCSPNRQYSVGS